MGPLFGRMDIGAAVAAAPLVDSLDPDPWALPDAHVLQVSYEVEAEAALGLTPPALHPSIPPYATFGVTSFPESPVGPFTLAQVRLVARAGIRPRGVLLGAYTDSRDAADALRRRWGYRVDVADVHLTARHDTVRGTVRVGGRLVLDMAIREPQSIGGADLMLIDNLHLVRVASDGGAGVLVQVDPEYAIHAADRGRPVLDVFDGEAFHTGGLLRPVSPVVALACRADTDLPRPRFALDPVQPATRGGRRLATV